MTKHNLAFSALRPLGRLSTLYQPAAWSYYGGVDGLVDHAFLDDKPADADSHHRFRSWLIKPHKSRFILKL
jgi:hypothetical protein